MTLFRKLFGQIQETKKCIVTGITAPLNFFYNDNSTKVNFDGKQNRLAVIDRFTKKHRIKQSDVTALFLELDGVKASA